MSNEIKEVQQWKEDEFIPVCWATFMFFRHLGFASDNVYLRYNDEGDIFVGLHGDEYPEDATIRMGVHPDAEGFIEKWPNVMEAYQEGKIPDELLAMAWVSIPPMVSTEAAGAIIQSLIDLGITIPALDPDAIEDGTLTPAATKRLMKNSKWN